LGRGMPESVEAWARVSLRAFDDLGNRRGKHNIIIATQRETGIMQSHAIEGRREFIFVFCPVIGP